jgi:hypothetical protein
VPVKPFHKVIRVPGGRNDILQSGEGDYRCDSAALEIGKSIINTFIDFETQRKQRDNFFCIMSFPTKFGVFASSGFAQTLKDRPFPGVWKEAAEQIFPAELTLEISSPPAKARFFTAFSCPCDCELSSEQIVENGHGDLRPN